MNKPSGINDRPLREEVRKLGDLLGQVIQEQEGLDLFDKEETIRSLSKDSRTGDAESFQKLEQMIDNLPRKTAASVARAFTLFFDLVNLAEDRHRIRVLRERDRNQYPEPRRESIGAAIKEFRTAGYSAEDVQDLLNQIMIEPVFTAHPTEAKRRTIRVKLARLREYLSQLDNDQILQREEQRLDAQIHAELTSLWQTDMLRFRRPSVLNEVEYGISFMQRIWDVLPVLYQDLDNALKNEYPDHTFRLPRFIEFGSWIGGDRDGNPNVTPEITRETFELHHRTAVQQHLGVVRRLLVTISSSENQILVNSELKEAIDRSLDKWPECRYKVEDLSLYEPYRHWLSIMEWRLQQTLQVRPAKTWPDGAYRTADELAEDVDLMIQSLCANNSKILAVGALRDWKWQIEIFGLRLSRLDIRQESTVHSNVIDEILQDFGFEKPFSEMDKEERNRIKNSVGKEKIFRRKEHYSEETQQTLEVFETISKSVHTYGRESLGAYVISMTHSHADILTLLWLGKITGFCRCHEAGNEPCPLQVVPLFETIDDLRRAPEIMEALFKDESYLEHLSTQDDHQMIMIGYSDSSKDGGYLIANWSLYQAQRNLCSVADQHNISLFYFHGRGGSLGRGGGPAARSIRALPPQSVSTGLRMTEQGEVLAERYDNPAVTYRHLEQVIWATLMVNTQQDSVPEDEWVEACDQLARESYRAYRDLVEHPDFLTYFHQASPLDEIEALPIGSRPSRRSGKESLDDLRAIPWAFSWTQNRHLLPAWYGLGSGFHRCVDEGELEWDYIREMYHEWPFFNAILNNAMFGVAKADMYIAEKYIHLAADEDQARNVYDLVRQEYDLSRQALLKITGLTELLENIPWLERSIEVRNPYVDPLNMIQISWLQRLRAGTHIPDKDEQRHVEDLIRLTIYGIASGMRTTG